MVWLVRLLVVAAIVLVAGLVSTITLPGSPERAATVDGPVIALDEKPDAYPNARLFGRLRLRQGCLLLRTGVLLWPHGTSWDHEAEAVEFGGDFAGAPHARVGSFFLGGGGVIAGSSTSFRDLLGEAGAAAVRRCLASTRATHAVLARPRTAS